MWTFPSQATLFVNKSNFLAASKNKFLLIIKLFHSQIYKIIIQCKDRQY